jgi:hypothetical protein
MPVENHEVHPSTIHHDMRYTACQQKVRRDFYEVPVRRYNGQGELVGMAISRVLDTSSTGCRNVSFETDPACQGCKFPKDMEYINRMKELK